PEDAELGKTYYTVGLISGGVAANVVSPSAEAEVMFRTIGDGAGVRRAIASIESRVSIEHVLEVPPAQMTTGSGFGPAVLTYTPDLAFLSSWGQPLLFGPGSIHVAHTAHEFVSIPELHSAVDRYITIAKVLLTAPRD